MSVPAPRLRVVLADDHAVVREGIRMVLDAQPQIEVVGEADGGEEAVRLVRTLGPDVVVMDVGMPHLSGIEATRRIRRAHPGVQVVILTAHDNEEYLFETLRAGAVGYLLKKAAAIELVAAIEAAARGEPYLYPSVARLLVRDYLERAGGGADAPELLSEREREVLGLVAEGRTNREIADALFLSIKTVQTHRAHVMEKLNLRDRAELVHYAMRKGLVTPT